MDKERLKKGHMFIDEYFERQLQNKMHWAVHRHTAAELIVERANAEKEHMGLTAWEAAPDGKTIKTDVSIFSHSIRSIFAAGVRVEKVVIAELSKMAQANGALKN